MAKNISFGRGGTSSWADDDDESFQLLPLASKNLPMEIPELIEEDVIGNNEQQHDTLRQGHNDRYDDRRSGHENRRESYAEHRQDSRDRRPKNSVPNTGPWKLYVGNLPFQSTADDLVDFIGQEGIKDVRLPRYHDNRPSGFAYVEFFEKEHLLQALELDDQKFNGRHVKMDVALDRGRKTHDYERTDNRGERVPDNRREKNESIRERQRLTLLPRSTSTEKKELDAQKPSIFGEAKPRDENTYLERKKVLDRERKAKAKEVKEAKAKFKEEKIAQTIVKEVKSKPVARKGSHDNSTRGGRGRGRGSRRRSVGGRGRGALGMEKFQERKPEIRPKQIDPPARISIPDVAKTANVFNVLNNYDSDSD
ncbi:hypothetical protein CCR75_000722 [Bremia lactucae]|uniref:RRM domain-containing protein n=1 Tax=Bremia lactucae TaxID=4779 RepID=A0A976FIU4_BRELC|nr:hypothetical protein CCR75_000722 [Bremia lactucae]